ncbi:signal recognition particle-docking protein FtsY [Shewanella sp. VB17]|uniref:signal recognition particle-docking protein FtsY n=1 Tax=Shewanella sp. VB17 TaxID=2739432 RepID=UPI0015635571|nr:signal recognition particle-docking protein FtsY [Shewanella sp. VB17]NRD72295.1 signal recognition particle-docking protein FtsY [Shewanella sp. VB17]
MAKKGFFSWFSKDKSKDEVKVPATDVVIEPQDSVAGEDHVALAEKAADALARLAEQAQAQKEAEEAALAEKTAADALARLAEQAQAQKEAEEAALAEKAAADALVRLAEQAQAQKEAEEAALAEKAAADALARLAEQAQAQKEAEEAALAEKAAADALARLAEQAQAQKEAEEVALTEKEAAEAVLLTEAQAALREEWQPEPQAKPIKEGFFARLKRGLKRTSENIGSGFIGLFRGKQIDEDLFEELEEQLLIADVGVETTSRLIKSLTEQASRKQLKNGEALYELLREEMLKTLEPVSIPLVPENTDGPFVILMVGVNGVGKTTTIGKLAKQYQAEGKSVMLAAGDTFRAAAVEQLQVWGQRNDIPVVAQHTGADSASVLFDALQAARARKVDVLIADTAGRLQNKSHLMDELKKVVRVMKKLDENTPHEIMLTLDASTGQNAISQAELFQKAVGVSGITISKLDGTAKGGVIFAIADKFSIPIRYIGVGEQIDDLRTFDAKDFIDALFTQENEDTK